MIVIWTQVQCKFELRFSQINYHLTHFRYRDFPVGYSQMSPIWQLSRWPTPGWRKSYQELLRRLNIWRFCKIDSHFNFICSNTKLWPLMSTVLKFERIFRMLNVFIDSIYIYANSKYPWHEGASFINENFF